MKSNSQKIAQLFNESYLIERVAITPTLKASSAFEAIVLQLNTYQVLPFFFERLACHFVPVLLFWLFLNGHMLPVNIHIAVTNTTKQLKTFKQKIFRNIQLRLIRFGGKIAISLTLEQKFICFIHK